MGLLKIRTANTLARAISGTTSDGDILAFPSDQPNCFVRKGKVIGRTLLNGADYHSALSPNYTTQYMTNAPANYTLAYSSALTEGVAYNFILCNNTSDNNNITLQASSISPGATTLHVSGEEYGTAAKTVVVGRSSTQWIELIRIGTNIFIRL